MKAASISQLKEELNVLSQKEVVALCLRLAKYKKENKELLAYLLFDAHDVEGYLQTIKNEMNDAFGICHGKTGTSTRKACAKYYGIFKSTAGTSAPKKRRLKCCCIFAGI